MVFVGVGCGPEIGAGDSGGGEGPQVDADGDGAYPDADCDDGDPLVHVGAEERCNDLDDDCDGLIDEDAPGTARWYTDADGDGYGADDTTGIACAAPAGSSALGGDCDDADPDDHPAASEIVGNGDDDDCDGGERCFEDADDDGFLADAAEAFPSADADCDDENEALFSDPWGDCDDTDPDVSPDATEQCDEANVDEDCSGFADDDDWEEAEGKRPFYADEDRDGYGNPAVARLSCDTTAAYVENDADCDDTNADISPAAEEGVGTGIDEDCDGGELCFLDADGDGFVPSAWLTVVSADVDCADPNEAALGARFEDCDDSDADVSPDGVEGCNLVDDDCDASIDEGVESTWYADTDGDGYGDSGSSTLACTAPSGYVADARDCEDTLATVSPGGREVCGDGYDNDCDDDRGDCAHDGSYAATSADVELTGWHAGDSFGRSVAVGDFDADGVGDLLVGAPNVEDDGESDSGEAALFYGPLSGGISSVDADAWLAGSEDYFTGQDVAVGDLDGDGADDLVIGAYGASSNAGRVGVVYGGSRIEGTLTLYARTAYTGASASDYLGWSVSAGGDLDGDGMDELLMGAYGQDGGGSGAGSAYLVYGAARAWGTRSASTSDAIVQGVAGDAFGFSTAFVPDIDGDGLDEMAVGATFATGAAGDSGAGYLFLGDSVPMSGTLPLVSSCSLIMPGLVTLDFAGIGVGGVGDMNGDGYADVGTGSVAHDEAAADVGKLAIYTGGLALSSSPFATVVGVAAGDILGEEFTSPGDMDGDGADDLVVGAYGVDTAYAGAGAGYLFYGPLSGAVSASRATATFHGASGGDGAFGQRVASGAHDLTGDGVTDIVFGARLDDSDGDDAGAVYVWAGLGGE